MANLGPMSGFACTRIKALGNTLLCTRAPNAKAGPGSRPPYPASGPWGYVRGHPATYSKLDRMDSRALQMQRERGSGHSQEQGGARLRPCCKALLIVLLAIFLGSMAGAAIRKVPGAPKKLDKLQQEMLEVLRHPNRLKVPPVAFGEHKRTTTRRPLYDCSLAGSEDWATGTSVAKRDWCCENFGQGCRHVRRSQNGVSGGGTDLFECLLDRKVAWNIEQINWCCTKKGLGCPTTRSPEHRLNCSDVPPGGRGAWPAAKKKACHDAFQIPIVATPSAADADAALAPHLPSHGERARHSQAGLFRAAPLRKAQGGSYDCQEDMEHWMAEWSPTKKAWCCRHRGFACPPDPRTSRLK